MMLKVKNFTEIFDSMRIRIVNQSYPPKNTLAPLSPLGVRVRGLGGLESVTNLGVRGIMAV